jgi:hypothetical protein
MSTEDIWVFHGDGARFSGGVFTSLEKAEAWIFKHSLSGLLTAYPKDVGSYDWCVDNGFFTPKKEVHKSSQFVGGFTSAHQEHYHYENGTKE